MDKAEIKNFGKPEEVREFPKGRVELIKIGGATIGRAVFEPGLEMGDIGSTDCQDQELRSSAPSVSCLRSAEG